jgi:hypothetical protein
MLVFFILSGSKPKPKIDASLVGKWKYLSSSGGITGRGAGWNETSTIIFEFKKKGTFKKIENKKTTTSDTFSTESTAAGDSGEKNLKIIFKNQPAMVASFTNDTLFLQEDVADGFEYVFVRSR